MRTKNLENSVRTIEFSILGPDIRLWTSADSSVVTERHKIWVLWIFVFNHPTTWRGSYNKAGLFRRSEFLNLHNPVSQTNFYTYTFTITYVNDYKPINCMWWFLSVCTIRIMRKTSSRSYMHRAAFAVMVSATNYLTNTDIHNTAIFLIRAFTRPLNVSD